MSALTFRRLGIFLTLAGVISAILMAFGGNYVWLRWIDLEGQELKSADVYLFSEPGGAAPVPDGQLASLIYTP